MLTPLQQQLLQVRATLPQDVELVAVSKFHPVEALQEAYDAGQRIFGESRVQELEQKRPLMPADTRWHFIGHLQANKVKYIAPYVELIHAVDSLKLLVEIDRQAARCGRIIHCLLQVHVAQENTKYGFLPNELFDFLEKGEWRALSNTCLAGLMCMATNTDNEQQIRQEFHQAKSLFEQVKVRYFSKVPTFSQCSWGMSDDYPIAIEEGSTLIRVGSKIFGERHY
ncbi:YggS family pyridoxal phosphate-dependent enzyme [Alloprevotella sp. Lung230]|uniref:YggS family pyridoxal phosphate-dependent enzyme n=1 Tax=Alloprevotella sp. Lung230 TaxID=2766595 RepID=UPI001655ADA5|nr:YggS family pyridoxal phosphate-dependent enzyme [Alloprevotella sp. Lung230]MBC8625630.1 YggS family pyridoxal phosphate-dependent enzyme [Alloprevotella sp. Lung230]